MVTPSSAELLVLGWEEERHRDSRASNCGPQSRRIGRTLIEKSLPFQLDAQTRLEIGRRHVRCVVTMAV